MAVQLHPDKRPGHVTAEHASAAFQRLTQAYRALHERASSLEATFDQLRVAARHEDAPPIMEDRRFELAKFNSEFERFRVGDPAFDAGYADWMATAPPEAQKSVVVRRPIDEPEPVCSSRGRRAVGYVELGAGAADDYSSLPGRRSQYMDYRVAHTTHQLLPEGGDRALEARPDNLEAIKAARTGQSFEMTDADRRALEDRAAARAEAEAARKETMARSDTAASDAYRLAHMALRGRLA
jgi:hypothetical protein